MQFIADGIKLSCKGGKFEKKRDNQKDIDNYLELTYNDENTGEYECRSSSDPDQIQILSKIYVKFRSKFLDHLHYDVFMKTVLLDTNHTLEMSDSQDVFLACVCVQPVTTASSSTGER